VWRSNFGKTLAPAGAGGLAIPEPACAALVNVALVTCLVLNRGRSPRVGLQ
jgi:hypothetical protein